MCAYKMKDGPRSDFFFVVFIFIFGQRCFVQSEREEDDGEINNKEKHSTPK